MRNHFRLVYFLIPLLCVFIGINSSNSAEIKSYPAAEIAIIYEAYNVNKTLDDSSETVTVNDHVQGVHPAAEVLELYDTYFNARGWISSFEICQRNCGGSWRHARNRCTICKAAIHLLAACKIQSKSTSLDKTADTPR